MLERRLRTSGNAAEHSQVRNSRLVACWLYLTMDENIAITIPFSSSSLIANPNRAQIMLMGFSERRVYSRPARVSQKGSYICRPGQ
jgi:hypothetical protein